MTKAYPVVATQHGEFTESEVKALAHGTAAMLVRDPLNKYDSNAIAVYIDGRRVGYIPKNQNKVLAQFIDQQGQAVHVVKMAQDAKPTDSVAATAETRAAIPARFIRSPNSNFPMVEV